MVNVTRPDDEPSPDPATDDPTITVTETVTGAGAGAGAAPVPAEPTAASPPATIDATRVCVSGPIGVQELLPAVVDILKGRGCSLIGLSVTPKYRPPAAPAAEADDAANAAKRGGGERAGGVDGIAEERPRAPAPAPSRPPQSQSVSAEFVIQRDGRPLHVEEHSEMGRELLEALAQAAAVRSGRSAAAVAPAAEAAAAGRGGREKVSGDFGGKRAGPGSLGQAAGNDSDVGTGAALAAGAAVDRGLAARGAATESGGATAGLGGAAAPAAALAAPAVPSTPADGCLPEESAESSAEHLPNGSGRQHGDGALPAAPTSAASPAEPSPLARVGGAAGRAQSLGGMDERGGGNGGGQSAGTGACAVANSAGIPDDSHGRSTELRPTQGVPAHR